MKDPSRLYRWTVLVASLLTIGYLVAGMAQENYLAEWQILQRKYRVILEKKATDELGRGLLKNFRIQLRQVSVPQLGAVDRCPTCHTGIDDPRMTDVPIPFAVHPGDLLAHHPVERFGCTVCHEGQGAAITYRGAAHEELEFWDRPMWRGKYLQSSCGKCHKEPSSPQTPLLSAARILYKEEFACDTCHKIQGEGGSDCPDLTYVGSKPLRAFDFTHLKGQRTRQRWLFAHFKDPQAVTPDSAMPNVKMTDDQALALTALMLSLTDDRIPSEYIVREPRATPQFTPASVSDSSLFEQKGCLVCHTSGGQGGELGPELAAIAGRRNADWLFQHFKNPSRSVHGSKRAPMSLSDAEANELTRYVLSLK